MTTATPTKTTTITTHTQSTLQYHLNNDQTHHKLCQPKNNEQPQQHYDNFDATKQYDDKKRPTNKTHDNEDESSSTETWQGD